MGLNKIKYLKNKIQVSFVSGWVRLRGEIKLLEKYRMYSSYIPSSAFSGNPVSKRE